MLDSIVSRLLAHASSHPDDAAIVDERRLVTYAELSRRVMVAAAQLHQRGVRAGDILALALGAREDAADFACVLYAAGHLGAAVLPLYPDAPAERRRRLADRFGAKWLVAREPTGIAGAAMLALDELTVAGGSAAIPAPPRGDMPGRPALYQLSSGTTGEPKVILFSHAQLYRNSVATLAHFGLGAADRLLPAVPAPEKMGMRYLLRILAAGGALVNLPFPASRQALGEVASRFGVTAVCASPWQLRRLVKTAPDPAGASRRLRMLACIGAMVTAEEIRAFRRELTPNVHASYSSTECGGVAANRPGDDAGDGYAPYPETAVQVVDPSGALLPTGSAGAIRVRVPSMPAAYAGNAAASAERFRDGWFYPGDTGYLDTRGRLFVQGRSDGAINFGGVKVMPEEVEVVLMAHPGVADAVVTSMPDAMAGEIPVAFVVLSPPATLEALKRFCEARLDATAIPALILSLERMPRSADGKVERARLKEHARSLSHMLHSTKP